MTYPWKIVTVRNVGLAVDSSNADDAIAVVTVYPVNAGSLAAQWNNLGTVEKKTEKFEEKVVLFVFLVFRAQGSSLAPDNKNLICCLIFACNVPLF